MERPRGAGGREVENDAFILKSQKLFYNFILRACIKVTENSFSEYNQRELNFSQILK